MDLGAGDDRWQVGQHAVQVGMAVEQYPQQRPGAAADIADPGIARPVDRRGQRQAVQPPAGRHGGVERPVAVGVGRLPVEERRAVGGCERVGDARLAPEVGDSRGHLGAGGELRHPYWRPVRRHNVAFEGNGEALQDLSGMLHRLPVRR